jgi:hypothetical protein
MGLFSFFLVSVFATKILLRSRKRKLCEGSSEISRTSTFANWIVTLSFSDHKYHVTNSLTKEKIQDKIVSVTEFIANMFPKFDATEAIPKMNSERRFAKYGNMSDFELIRYWNENGTHASTIGTAMHATIELFLKNVMKNVPQIIPEMPPPIPSNFSPEVPTNLNDEGIVVKAEHFMELVSYLDEKHIRPVAVEKLVYSDELKLAGCVDAIFEDTCTHKLLLYDWKRRPEFSTENRWQNGEKNTPTEKMSDCHYSHALVQLNLYRALLRGEGIKISEMHIISLHPSLPTFLDNAIEMDDNLVEELISYRLREIST